MGKMNKKGTASAKDAKNVKGAASTKDTKNAKNAKRKKGATGADGTKGTIRALAISRIRYNRSRSILTAVAIMLTTTLLMGIGTCAVGLLDMTRQEAVSESNIHASFAELSQEQVNRLKNHMDVEALEISETFASVEYDRMNGVLNFSTLLKGDIYHGTGSLTEGREPVSADEICGPPAFFERMGADPVIGNTIEISFRPHGEGMAETRQFVICGLVTQVDMSKLDVSDSRISYSADISEALVEEYFGPEERSYNAAVRILGEEELTYDEIVEKIGKVAEDIGYDAEKVSLNKGYLYTMTESGGEMMPVVGGVTLLVILFAGLVIYSIYYVSVITDIQEIGRLKALGASDKQIKKALLAESMCLAVFAIPAGLLLGYLIPFLGLPVVVGMVRKNSIMQMEIGKLHMFSPYILLLVAVAVLVIIRLSLRRPMKIAAKISPVEALRYQESSGKAKFRKGRKSINLFGLSAANLLRNKKRTIVTIVTMGLSCVLFMSLAGALGSMRAENVARREIRTGDFRLRMEYSFNDKAYPERNLKSLQQRNFFDEALRQRILSLDGVKGIESDEFVWVESDFPSVLFTEWETARLSYLDREEAEAYRKILEQGEIDYDAMAAGNGAVFTTNYFMEELGLSVGDEITLTVHDGNREIPLTVTLTASIDTESTAFLVTKEVWDNLGMQFDATTAWYISVEPEQYDNVKAALQEIEAENEYFRLYSMDEEMEIGRQGVMLIKYSMYGVMGMIAVISFMNLINTMVTSIATRKKELGILQSIGLSDRQLTKMLAGEGMVYTAGTLLASLSVGNLFGYLIFVWAKKNHFVGLNTYHYPLMETILLSAVLILGQLGITLFISKRVRRESLIEQMRSGE